MYFHPSILTEAQKQQRLAAYHDLARLWLDGIDRQYRLHTDAFAAFCARQQEALQALSAAFHNAGLLARWSGCAVRAPLGLLQVSIGSNEIAVDVQRQIAVLVNRHGKEPRKGAGELDESERGVSIRADASVRGQSRRGQMMA
jgi:hypothetical protein